MKTNSLPNFLKASMLVLSMVIITISSCKKEDETDGGGTNDTPGAIQGAPGNPRFNLQFTNGTKTDLDLYVETPNGNLIYFDNLSADNGKLDVDCLCDDCPNGPNENVYWTPGTAPKGNYKVYVKYYGDCDNSNATSDYTLRIMNNSTIIKTYNGTLSPSNTKSPVYTFNFQ